MSAIAGFQPFPSSQYFTSHISRHSSFAKTSKQLRLRLFSTQKRWTKLQWQTPVRSLCRIGHTTPQYHRPKDQIYRVWYSHARANSSPHANPSSGNDSAHPTRNQPTPQPYQPPTSGVISHLPRSWIPYAELVRLDKPVGTYYLFLPCLFSTLLAAPLATPMAAPLTVLQTSGLFLLGALIMRGAGCTINDLWDRDLDPHVERTRLRPIARGAVSVQQAIPFLGLQLFAGLGVLLSLPTQCLWYGVPSLLLVTAYPLAKRVTNYPQLVLGLTFSWGAVMGFPALGVDLLSPDNYGALLSAGCLYTSCVAWTVVYDMIYAYQDIRDDVAAGIKSIALAQQTRAKAFLTAIAAVQVGLLTGAGVFAGAGPVFFMGSCAGAAGSLGYMIRAVDLGSVKDCWRWFRKGAWFTGGTIASGLTGEYAARRLGWYEDPSLDTGK